MKEARSVSAKLRRMSKIPSMMSPHSFIPAVSNASAASDAMREKEYAQIWLSAENVFLPPHLQPMGSLFTAQITLLVSSEKMAGNIPARKGSYTVPKESWSEYTKTSELELTAQGGIGHSFFWPDAIQIARTTDPIQLVRFEIKINANVCVGSITCNLPGLLLANDGGTHETKKQFKCDNSGGADSILRISAQSRVTKAFNIDGIKAAKTVMTCHMTDLRIRTATGVYKLKEFQKAAMRRLRERMDASSTKKIEKHASEILIVEPTTGKVLYIDKLGHPNEIFYMEPPLHPMFKTLLYVHRFIFLLKKKYRTYKLGALHLPNIGMTTPRFDDIANMLWKRSGRSGISSPKENFKPLRRNLQATLAKGRKTLEEAVDANQANVLSIVFIPTLKFDEKLLAKLPNKMMNRQQLKELKERLDLWHEFVASWTEEERVRTKTIFKELNGEAAAAEVKRHRRNTALSPIDERDKLFKVMHSAELRDARVSPKTLAAARNAAMEKLPAADFLVRCAQLQELNHWEYTQYTQALGLLKHLHNELLKLSSFNIELAVQRAYGQDTVYKQLSKSELHAHAEFHKLCVQLSWYRHILLTAERILRYKRLSLLNSTTNRRVQTLKKLQAEISKFGADVKNITYEKVLSPLEQFKEKLEKECASRVKASMGHRSLSMQHLAVEKAMQPVKKWQKIIRSSESWQTFITQVIGTSTQMIKMLKWSHGATNRRESVDAIVRASCVALPTVSVESVDSELERDTTLKSLDGDYKLEACTPFHLNFVIMKLVHKIWEKHFSEKTNFKQFLAIVPQITSGEETAMVQVLGMAKSLEVFKTIKTSLDNAKVQLSKNLLSTIQYLDYKYDREKYRIQCKNGFITDCVGTPFDTETKFSNAAGKGFAIFVFHKKMGMFASSHVHMHFHHSSFLAGHPVHFAGELKVVKGILTVVTPKSGHYKPRKLQGLNFMRWLRDNGFNLDEIEYREKVDDPLLESDFRAVNAKVLLAEYEADLSLSPPPPVPKKPKDWKQYRKDRDSHMGKRPRDSLSVIIHSISSGELLGLSDESLEDDSSIQVSRPRRASSLRKSKALDATSLSFSGSSFLSPFPAIEEDSETDANNAAAAATSQLPNHQSTIIEESPFSEASSATFSQENASAAIFAASVSEDPVPSGNPDSDGISNSPDGPAEASELPVQDIVVLLKSAMNQARDEEKYDLAYDLSETVKTLENGADRASACGALNRVIEMLSDLDTFDPTLKKLEGYL